MALGRRRAQRSRPTFRGPAQPFTRPGQLVKMGRLGVIPQLADVIMQVRRVIARLRDVIMRVQPDAERLQAVAM